MKIFKTILLALLLLFAPQTSFAQFSLSKAISAGAKAVRAMSLSDKQLTEYVRESVKVMDRQNPVAGPNSPYTQRLMRLTSGLKSVDGVPLNFKVYEVKDVNAFACADGSVRVFSAIMDMMDDDELLGIVGHEIGHVGLHHSKKALKQQLLTGALKDAVEASGGKAAALSESMLGTLGNALINAKYSQKQEKEADDYGYDFLKKNGKNPWGMVHAFEKMEKLEQSAGVSSSYLTKMFSSHPDTQARIKHMKDRCTKDKISDNR